VRACGKHPRLHAMEFNPAAEFFLLAVWLNIINATFIRVEPLVCQELLRDKRACVKQ